MLASTFQPINYLLSWSWLLDGVANSLLLYAVARMVLWTYQEHTYLYQFEDWQMFYSRWVDFILPVVKKIKAQKYRERIDLLLSRAGSRKDWSSSHFMATQILLSGGMFVVTYLLLKMILNLSIMLPIACAICAAVFPYMKLSEIAQKRFNSCNRDLPFVLDYLSLCMGSGLDFNQALHVVTTDAPKSPLVDELKVVERNLKLGMSRKDALIDLQERLQSPIIKQFVQTMVQGMELGSDVIRTIRATSETLRSKRFQVAEEIAGKISVRMMIPMMCFIMPSVMIILMGPMLLTYLAQG